MTDLSGLVIEGVDLGRGAKVYVSIRCRNNGNLLSTVVSTPAIAVLDAPTSRDSYITMVSTDVKGLMVKSKQLLRLFIYVKSFLNSAFLKRRAFEYPT